MNYELGHNIPGYLPMADEPTILDTFDEAKRALIDDILRDADSAADVSEDWADTLAATAEDVNLWNGPDSVVVCNPDSEHDLGVAYWVIEVEEVVSTDDILDTLTDDGKAMDLPDGRRVRLAVEPDLDYNIVGESGDGMWCGSLEWVRGIRSPRPDGFNGAARVIDTDGYDRLWWQPPTDIVSDRAACDELRRSILDCVNYGGSGVIVTVEKLCPTCQRWEDDASASLWGIDAASLWPGSEGDYLREVVSELLAEVGLS